MGALTIYIFGVSIAEEFLAFRVLSMTLIGIDISIFILEKIIKLPHYYHICRQIISSESQVGKSGSQDIRIPLDSSGSYKERKTDLGGSHRA